MRNRRQPSEQFFRRLEAYREPEPASVVEPEVKPPSRIRKFHEGDGWLWAEVCAATAGLIGLVFLIPTGYSLWIDLEDREQQRIAQAWELVTRVAPGNSGKGPALEYLNSQGISLTGIDLSTESNKGVSYLRSVDLSKADLLETDLSGANLSHANLLGAYLNNANLRNADRPVYLAFINSPWKIER